MIDSVRAQRGDFEGVATKFVGAHVPEQLKQDFDAAAKARGRSRSDLLRAYVEQEVAEYRAARQEPLVQESLPVT